jgi:uncharacterized membrane protein YbhN (UPF0104 family)
MDSKKVRTTFSLIVLVLIVWAGVYYLVRNPELLTALGNISWAQAVTLIILRALFLGSNGLFLKEFAAKFDVKLTTREWFGLPFVTTMGNHLAPLSGGMLVRATYLKYQHTMPYSIFATLLAASYLVTFWVMGVLGFFLSLILYKEVYSVWMLGLFFLFVFCAISLLMIAPNFNIPGDYALVKVFNKSLEGWILVKGDSRLLIKLTLYTSTGILLNGLAFWLSYLSLDIGIAVSVAFLISLSSAFSVILTITPGNFGIREAIISVTSELAGVGIGEGLIVALIIRASTLVSAFTLGPLFSYLLARQVRY